MDLETTLGKKMKKLAKGENKAVKRTWDKQPFQARVLPSDCPIAAGIRSYLPGKGQLTAGEIAVGTGLKLRQVCSVITLLPEVFTHTHGKVKKYSISEPVDYNEISN